MANTRPRQADGGGRARPRPPPSESDRIIEAALAGIARQGWRRLSLADIAAGAGLPILRVYRLVSLKAGVLRRVFRAHGRGVLACPAGGRARRAAARPGVRPVDAAIRRTDAAQG